MNEGWLRWLGDLSTYRPSDFLMFAPRTYWRLFELHNEAWWPLPLLLPGMGLVVILWLRLPRRLRLRLWLRLGSRTEQSVVALGLAAVGLFVAQAFVLARYAPINWAAPALAWLLAAQALSLIALALTGALRPAADPLRRRAGLVLALWALFGHPLLGILSGRPLAQAEVFGLAPDPTLLATLAWLLQASVRSASAPARWAWRGAWAIALVQCAISAATLATMEEPQAAVMGLAGLLAGLMALASRRRGRPAGTVVPSRKR